MAAILYRPQWVNLQTLSLEISGQTNPLEQYEKGIIPQPVHLGRVPFSCIHKYLEKRRCVFSKVVTDVLVLTHKAISIHSGDQLWIAFDQFV